MSSEENITSTGSVGQSAGREPDQEHTTAKPISRLLGQQLSPSRWKTLKDKLQGSTALLFSLQRSFSVSVTDEAMLQNKTPFLA